MKNLYGQEPYQIEACEGYGCIPARFMFVGISAGKLGALQTKVPLTKDGSGRIFQRLLGVLKLSSSDEYSIKPVLQDCYLTNFVKGRILDEKGNNRLPTDKEFAWWADTLNWEIQQVRPEIIIALGQLVYDQIRKCNIGIFLGCYSTIRQAKHPRWYFSHGALNPNSKAFKQMVLDYHELLSNRAWASIL